MEKLVIHSRYGGNCRLRSQNRLSGKGLKSTRGKNPNELYAVPVVPQPLVNDQAGLNKVELANTYVYDLPTQAGESYIVTGK